MPLLARLLLPLALALSTLLLPAFAAASEPHGWCTTGAPMVPNGSPDPTTAQVLAGVCGNAAAFNCCVPSGRWSLSCVQLGAAYAKEHNLSGGDYCGRYAWAQGPVGTQQAYPRDFNLFATAGSVSGMRDVDGSVAASTDVTASYFNLNVRPRETTAVVAGGNVRLLNGSVNGSVVYAGGYSDNGQVTYSNGTRPTAPTRPSPIDFAAASTKLIAMSKQVALYDSIPASKVNQTVTFTGSDPELNVFSISAALLTGTTSYVYSVPAGSTVIVNVSGTSASLANAGFSGPVPANRMLWNFPDATTLSMTSLSFAGSILAPKAAASLTNGNLAGTVVVASAQPLSMELYSAPFQVPSCGGGLCLDPTWSASADTLVDDQAKVGVLAPEAGFLEIVGQNYTAENAARTSPTNRMWYAFQPATSMPKNKPLAVFFNGGPGAATSSMLFSFNTATMTLDPQRTSSIAASSTPWTTFANLLYIDAPATGFSYPVANADGTKPDIGTDEDEEAGIFTRVLLRFLQRHPALQSNRVLIVGESYGGERATLMLQYLFDYANLAGTNAPYQDAQLASQERSYFTAVFGTGTPTAAQIASKFDRQVLIEPVVAGKEQGRGFSKGSADAFPLTNCLSPTCMTMDLTHPVSCDPYNCDKPPSWSDNLVSAAAARLTNVATLATALGVNPRTIEWMKASSRTKAYGRNEGESVPNPTDMVNTFGALGSEDNYFMVFNDTVLAGYGGGTTRKWASPGAGLLSATDYVNHLRRGVATFITVTNFDTVVYTPDIPYALEFFRENDATFKSLVSSLGYSKTNSTGLARPGDSSVTFASDGAFRRVVMPFSYASGHTVSMRAPAELLQDVMLWYKNPPP